MPDLLSVKVVGRLLIFTHTDTMLLPLLLVLLLVLLLLLQVHA
jgi:hypothetical protein